MRGPFRVTRHIDDHDAPYWRIADADDKMVAYHSDERGATAAKNVFNRDWVRRMADTTKKDILSVYARCIDTIRAQFWRKCKCGSHPIAMTRKTDVIRDALIRLKKELTP